MSDRGVYRGVYAALVDDPDYQAMSSAARHVLLTLRVCPQNNAASFFRVYPSVLVTQTGYGPARLARALGELEVGRWIERDGWLIWIRNGLRFDPNLSLADRKHRKAVERAISAHEKSPLYARFCDYYQISRAFEGPSKGLARASGEPSPPSTTPSTRKNPSSTPSDDLSINGTRTRTETGPERINLGPTLSRLVAEQKANPQP